MAGLRCLHFIVVLHSVSSLLLHLLFLSFLPFLNLRPGEFNGTALVRLVTPQTALERLGTVLYVPRPSCVSIFDWRLGGLLRVYEPLTLCARSPPKFQGLLG